MFWFNKKKERAIVKTENLKQHVQKQVEKNQAISKETVEEATQATKQFNKVLKENGFTLKIHVAAGGKR